ncbi:TPA: hypothetical protein MJC53_12040 [Klebsiella pneumoniae]|nr:hypothetical protein [Klebsiella pneumoniae]
MTKSTITRERLEKIKSWRETYGTGSNVMLPAEEAEELARMALAAMDGEPVAVTDERNLGYIDRGRETAYLWGKQNSEASDVALYRHAQPAPKYPETLPCPVLLEPGLRFSKGIKTSTMLAALARRAVHESDMAALSPEERAEFQARIEDFKALIAQPAPDDNGLLPCPFCGGEPEEDVGGYIEYHGHEHQDYSITCKQCGAEVYCSVGTFENADVPCSRHHDTRKVCVDKWNKRAAILQAGNSPAQNHVSPEKNSVAPAQNPIDHGYRPECECSGCKATARICAELSANSSTNPDCWFCACRPVVLNDMRFVVCPDCGNKRCPRANDHRNACTGSNEPGQEGSTYPDTPREVK